MFKRKPKKGTSRLPCHLCQLQRPIGTDDEDLSLTHGHYCEWFSTRIPPEELDDPYGAVRSMCIKNGNHFRWTTPGVSAHEYLGAVREHMEWSERFRTYRATVWGVAVALLTLLVPYAATALGF